LIPRVRVVAALLLVTCIASVGAERASAAQPPVGLGAATTFAILGGQTVTNTGPTVITGNVGVSPGSAVGGFPPGMIAGAVHTDVVSLQAQNDLIDAYNDASGRTPATVVSSDLGGQTLVAGVYAGGELGVTGTLTLDAQGDPNAVFVFQAASTLITASASVVALTNGADVCNVFWRVGSSTTLGTNSVFLGTVMSLTSISATTGANVTGRLLARNGAVTLDSNIVAAPVCAQIAPTTTTAPATTVAEVTTIAGGVDTTVSPTAPTGTGIVGTTVAIPPSVPPVSGTLPATGSNTTAGIFGAGVGAFGFGVVLLAFLVFIRRPRRI